MADLPKNSMPQPQDGAETTGHRHMVPERSWGDKYKHKAAHAERNLLVNYGINFTSSALIAYTFLTSKWNTKLEENAIEPLKNWIGKGKPGVLSDLVAKFFTRTQLLMIGGHTLLYYMRYSHNHRREREFEYGHRLDRLQETLGLGNAATKHNLAEYKYIKDIMKAKPDSATLNAEDKALLAKHCIDDDSYQFKENTQTWGQVWKARGMGVASTTALSFAMAFLSDYAGPEKHDIKWLNIDQKIKNLGAHIGEGINKSPVKFKNPSLLGELIVLETIYTLASKLGFDHMEKRQALKQQKKEEQEAALSLKHDKEVLANSDGIADGDGHSYRTKAGPSATETRRAILEKGPQSFRARESATAASQGAAL